MLASPALIPPPRRPLQRKSTVCGLNGSPPRLVHLARHLPFKSSDPSRYTRGSCAFHAFFRGALLIAPLSARKICNSIFSRSKAANSKKNKPNTSSHCSSVQERLVTYGSEALDTAEHLGLILGSQKAADTLLKHFGSLAVLARASVEELLPFVSRAKALRVVSSLRMGAVALREERQSLIIDGPEAIADLCCEMRFLDREWLRVVLLNTKQHFIKVAPLAKGVSMNR